MYQYVRILFDLLRPANAENRAAALELEGKRKALNDDTEKALGESPDPTQRIPPPLYEQLASLNQRQIMMQQEIKQKLSAETIRTEQALRAGATSVFYQMSLLLRRVELRCAELAWLGGGAAGDEFDLAHRAAEGDLSQVQGCIVEVQDAYITPLRSRSMRRERIARRVLWLLSFGALGAFDRDRSANDLRQYIRHFDRSIQESRAALRVFSNDFLSTSLRVAATDYADRSDADLIKFVAGIVERAAAQKLAPADINFPVLIVRMWSIRAILMQLPTWSWSTRWLAYTGVLQAWLQLFAAVGASLMNDREVSGEFLQECSEGYAYASALITEAALLERGLKPAITRLSMIGAQREIRGFPAPPSRAQLLALCDKLSAQLNKVRAKLL